MPHFRAFRYRLYPDAVQRELFRKTEGCCRFVRNAAHEQRVVFGGRRVGSPPHRINYFTQRAELKALKAEFPWLTEVPHHCLQEALVDLETAWKRFFKGEAGFPRYRSKSHDGGFRFPDPKQFAVGKLGIQLPKAGLVPWVLHRPIEGRLKSVTVVREGDHWYASVLCEIARELPAPKALSDALRVDGADAGVEVPLATVSGLFLDLPRTSERAYERERRLQRTIARCKKGSKNRRHAARALARHQAKVRRRRKHGAHQASRQLLADCDVLGLEALRVKNMTASARGTVEEPGSNVAQKAGLNRNLLDLGLGQLRMTCQWQAAKMGKRVILVDPAYTSQTCPMCQHCSGANRPWRDLFLCQVCSFTGHADVVAAMNIKARAEEALRQMTAEAVSQSPAEERSARRRDRGGSPWRAPHRATLRSGKMTATATAAVSPA